MSTKLVNAPLGTTGAFTVTESAGAIVIALNDALPSDGISGSLSITISGSVLLAALAAGTTNATLKAILSEAAALVGGLPV